MDAAVLTAVTQELARDEGERLRVYDDATGLAIVAGTLVKGNPTIGVGRNLAARGISAPESDLLLAHDLGQCEAELVPVLPWLASAPPPAQVVVYSLYFNTALGDPERFVGPHGWPHFLAQCAAGDWQGAASNLETSQPWASEVGARAARLANLLRSVLGP